LLPIDAGWRGSFLLRPEVIVTNARGRDRCEQPFKAATGDEK
jgi:hypothetical protein